MKFTFADLFAGIGGMRLALEMAGGECAFACEIDRHAAAVYSANFGQRVSEDIRNVEAGALKGIDIIAAGFPCQSFSALAANRGGLDDARGEVFHDLMRLIRAPVPAQSCWKMCKA